MSSFFKSPKKQRLFNLFIEAKLEILVFFESFEDTKRQKDISKLPDLYFKYQEAPRNNFSLAHLKE